MAQLKERTKERETTVIDGHVYDAETGEYVEPAERQGFAITDKATAEWFSEKISIFDADIKAIEIRKQSIISNCDTMIADVEKARNGMLWKYGKQLEDYARRNLPRGKKTWTCEYLSVAFRTTKDRVTITDKVLALKWADDNKVESAVKTTREVQIGLVSDEVKHQMMSGALQVDGFEVRRGGETVKIETGIE